MREAVPAETEDKEEALNTLLDLLCMLGVGSARESIMSAAEFKRNPGGFSFYEHGYIERVTKKNTE